MTACAPKRKLCPPKRGLCPKEINKLGATGVQIESQIGVFCGLTSDFMTWDYGRKMSRKISEDVFFLRLPVFGRENRLNFRFRPKIPFSFDPEWDKFL